MKGWKEIRFGDALEEPVRNGIYKSKEFHGDGVKIINMGELFSHPRLRDIPMKRIILTEKEKSKSLVKNGDLIFARRSLTAEGAGKCSIALNISEETTFESSIIRARLNKEIALPLFLFYFFNSIYGKYLLGTILRQVAVSGITGADLSDLNILLPPLPEQRAIAAVLGSLDDKVDLLHRQNATLEAMAEALFRQWFMIEAKEGWKRQPLSSIAEFLNGLACQKYKPKNSIERLPVLKIRELTSGISADSDWAASDVPKEYIIKAGDVIFSWSGSLLVKIWHGEQCFLNQHLFKVTSATYPKWFYYFWCKYHLREFISISESHATTMGHIKRSDLDAAVVAVPSCQELKKMSEMMEPLLSKFVYNQTQILTLEKLRDTLLPKLMSGEVRVAY